MFCIFLTKFANTTWFTEISSGEIMSVLQRFDSKPSLLASTSGNQSASFKVSTQAGSKLPLKKMREIKRVEKEKEE